MRGICEGRMDGEQHRRGNEQERSKETGGWKVNRTFSVLFTVKKETVEFFFNLFCIQTVR